MSHTIKITFLSLVICTIDAILSYENNSFKRLQTEREILLAFYHPVLFYGLLNHASNKRTWLIKLGFNKPLYNFYYSLELGILYIIKELILQTRDDL